MADSEAAAVNPPSAASQALVARAPWWMLPMLALVAEGAFILALVLAFRGDDKTLQNLMAFATVTQAGLAFGYFYTSSLGSQKKDETMAASSAVKDDMLAASNAALATSTPVLALPPPVPEPPVPATPTTPPAGAMRPTGAT